MPKRKLTNIAGMRMREIKEEFMSVADLQRRIMPDPERLTVFGDFDIYGKTLPIAVVGGDFYDFIDLQGRFGIQGKMGIVIADAAGHGLVAAMLIRDFNTALYTAISFQSYYVQDTTPLLFTKINRRMYRSSQANQFISAFYGELQLGGILRYINAGHYSPLLFKKGGGIESLDAGGLVLGAFRQAPHDYQVGQVQLEPGEILVCYTDGIIESANSTGDEYGEDRLKAVVEQRREKTSRAILGAIVQDVKVFSGEEKQKDDRTLIVIKKSKRAKERIE